MNLIRRRAATTGKTTTLIGLILSWLLLTGCSEQPWNSPYPATEQQQNILYQSFEERPKHLDPARSYSSVEWTFIEQIYEAPLQYHFLKRPYELISRTATSVPVPQYIDAEGNPLPHEVDPSKVAFSLYDIHLQPGILYQPHPAFAKNPQGEFLYHELSDAELEEIEALDDFKVTDSRPLSASDYVYQIKRLAHPSIHSPIFGLMSEYIVGLDDLGKRLHEAQEQIRTGDNPDAFLDLREFELEGVEVVSDTHYRVKIKGVYPQFQYWLAMPFFAAVPWEADRFYAQPGLVEKNIVMNWYPVGTGPYMLTVNNPNKEMILEKNPNFRGETYPEEGEAGDKAAGYLQDAGKTMPFIDRVVFKLEKETIPYWNKFLQGYYDTSGIASDSFDQAIQVGSGGEVQLTEQMQEKGIQLLTAVAPSVFYMGFNMLDPVVGGDAEQARLLRRAIAIAVDYEEYISIFLNGRGLAAQSPLPPGIFGYREGESGINPYVYDWVDGKPHRKSIEEAKALLEQAGYPSGRDAATGKPLVLNFDTTGAGPDSKAQRDWLVKQFKKLDIQLVIRATDYNRFQEKMLNGTAQLFQWGWNADYPDPENFMFLLYGPNGKVNYRGENAANYHSPEFDALFERMKNMDNGPDRQLLIDNMIELLRKDSPWLFGFNPKAFSLHHSWYKNAKPNLMSRNTLKYKRIEPVERNEKRNLWNQPVIWPIVAFVMLLIALVWPAVAGYRRHERASAHGGKS